MIKSHAPRKLRPALTLTLILIVFLLAGGVLGSQMTAGFGTDLTSDAQSQLGLQPMMFGFGATFGLVSFLVLGAVYLAYVKLPQVLRRKTVGSGGSR